MNKIRIIVAILIVVGLGISVFFVKKATDIYTPHPVSKVTQIPASTEKSLRVTIVSLNRSPELAVSNLADKTKVFNKLVTDSGILAQSVKISSPSANMIAPGSNATNSSNPNIFYRASSQATIVLPKDFDYSSLWDSLYTNDFTEITVSK